MPIIKALSLLRQGFFSNIKDLILWSRSGIIRWRRTIIKCLGVLENTRDSITSNALPGVTIILNDSFVTESKGAPEEGVYFINHPESGRFGGSPGFRRDFF